MGKDYAAICADPERKLQEWERVLLYLNDKYKMIPYSGPRRNNIKRITEQINSKKLLIISKKHHANNNYDSSSLSSLSFWNKFISFLSIWKCSRNFSKLNTLARDEPERVDSIIFGVLSFNGF
jgi:hypothetical protein